ncbi:hypothetical protein IEQ34_025385 [Dendrobium chrysotoxum]|uniref:Uncharacterized protein n=1 Tax=Dendrobium chrysotoxum TaxID=161865 RepID=A0AAV7FQ17_DENCH|nr:hypothetical protein IEQ34_025385 [Dendrobium chrysotoxum]
MVSIQSKFTYPCSYLSLVLTEANYGISSYNSAWQVYLGKRFFDYAVLGDDIVITGDGVAQKYAELIEQCEATISKE